MLWALLAALLLVGALAGVWQGSRAGQKLKREATATAKGTAVINAGAFTADDLKQPVTGERYEDLSGAVADILAKTPTTALTVWGPGGLVLFSTDHSEVGQRYLRIATTVIQALDGGVQSETADDNLQIFLPSS